MKVKKYGTMQDTSNNSLTTLRKRCTAHAYRTWLKSGSQVWCTAVTYHFCLNFPVKNSRNLRRTFEHSPTSLLCLLPSISPCLQEGRTAFEMCRLIGSSAAGMIIAWVSLSPLFLHPPIHLKSRETETGIEKGKFAKYAASFQPRPFMRGINLFQATTA